MRTVAERLAFALDAKRTNPTALSNAMSDDDRIPQTTIHRMANGAIKEPKADKLNTLARYLAISPIWLQTGRGAMNDSGAFFASEKNPSPYYDGLRATPRMTREAPLISWVMASNWGEAADPYEPGDGSEWFPAPRLAGPRAYYLQVRGTSMYNAANALSYPEGCYICVEPDLCSPNNGQHVIAKLHKESVVTFKVYVNEDGKQWLKPLNTQYDPIRDEFSVLGTVIGKFEKTP